MTPLMALGLAAGLVIAGETAAIMWSAKLLDEQAPDLAAIAGRGAAFFGWIATAISTGFAFGLCALAMLIALGLIFALRTTCGVPAPVRL